MRNDRFRRAIEVLGAAFEGGLRQWSPSRVPGEEGQLDSPMFSVIVPEWPNVRDHLRAKPRRGGRRIVLPYVLGSERRGICAMGIVVG